MHNDTVIILSNLRGGCANVGSTVHALFQMKGRPRLNETRIQLGANVEASNIAEIPQSASREPMR